MEESRICDNVYSSYRHQQQSEISSLPLPFFAINIKKENSLPENEINEDIISEDPLAFDSTASLKASLIEEDAKGFGSDGLRLHSFRNDLLILSNNDDKENVDFKFKEEPIHDEIKIKNESNGDKEINSTLNTLKNRLDYAFLNKVDDLVSGSTNSNKKVQKCHRCDKTFVNTFDYARHLRIHTGEKAFQCHYCNRLFLHLEQLTAHIQNHIGKKSLKNLHSKVFASESCLVSHTATRRNIVRKSFKCQHCKKSFSGLGGLKNHVRIIHMEQQPIKCESYKKSSSTNSNPIKMQTVVKCQHCDVVFSDNVSLKKHLLKYLLNSNSNSSHVEVSKEFSCHHCEISFPHSELLKIHLESHTEESFKSHYCGRSISPEELAKHSKEHGMPFSGITQFGKHENRQIFFKCQYCSKRFNNSGTLNRHVTRCVFNCVAVHYNFNGQ